MKLVSSNTKQQFFITATDTDAGKTHVAQLLIRAFVEKGNRVAVFKPISAGCELINGKLINDDAQQLLNQSNCKQTIEQVNPIAFKEPIAPHIAAAKLGQSLNIEEIEESYKDAFRSKSNILITEGAGGWRLPLGEGIFLSDFVKRNPMKIILVVNMKLGCLNHAVLTAESIIEDGLDCVGWVANCPENMDYLEQNIEELKSLLPMPCIGVVPKQSIETTPNHVLDLSKLSL